MNKKGISIFWTFLGIGYIVFALFPLFKNLFTKRNNETHDGWVEVPMLINK